MSKNVARKALTALGMGAGVLALAVIAGRALSATGTSG